jgi:hypothetical protein
MGDVGMRERQAQQAEAVGAVLREKIQRITAQQELRYAILDIRELAPGGAAAVDAGQRRHEQRRRVVVGVMVRHGEGIGRIRGQHDERDLPFGHIDPIGNTTAEDDRVALAGDVRAEQVQIGARVIERFGRAQLRSAPGIAIVEKRFVVGPPGDDAV